MAQQPDPRNDPDRTPRRWPQVLVIIGVGLVLVLIIVAHMLGVFRGPH